LPESATECTPSASMDADPVIAAATNLAVATPRLAPNAVSTTRALWSVDTKSHHSGGGFGGAQLGLAVEAGFVGAGLLR
jgi:hypothetical protein